LKKPNQLAFGFARSKCAVRKAFLLRNSISSLTDFW